MRWAFLFCVTLGAGGAAIAACPTAVVAKKVVVQEVAVAQVVTPVAAYQTLAVLVPAYAAAYHPAPAPAPAAPVAPAGPSADTKAILDALKALDGRLQALERTRPGAPASPAPAPPAPMPPAGTDDPFNPAGARAPAPGRAPAVFAAKCASCHQKGREDAGGGFVLLEADGSVAKLDARAVLATARRSYGGTMPPKKSSVAPLTDAEVAEVMAWLDTMK
jgi:mono/diheme cytochrome c family protein